MAPWYRHPLSQLSVSLIVAGLMTTPLLGEEKNAATKGDNAAIKAVSKTDKGWTTRHEKFLQRAKEGNVDVLFLGDSITQGWEGRGKQAWQENFESLKAANFGIGGDRTQHVLWRITEGKELEGIDPKVAVIMIGTNNMSSNSAPEIAEGISAIVRELRRQKPQTKVLLLGVFPRSAKADDQVRGKIKDVNKQIAKLDDGSMIRYLDIGDRFLTADGELTKEIMPDYLHLSDKGYSIWAEAVTPMLKQLVK